MQIIIEVDEGYEGSFGRCWDLAQSELRKREQAEVKWSKWSNNRSAIPGCHIAIDFYPPTKGTP